MAVTMKDIAKHCGVSEGAVSQVLRNPEHPRFSEATRQMIRETANRLDYRQNKLSLALSSKKTNMIGLMLPWNEPQVMDQIERMVSANGYKLMLQFTAHPREGAELDALKSFLDWNVGGIIWESSGVYEPDCKAVLKEIRKSHIPLVFLERAIVDGFPVIRTNFSHAIKKCVAHLKQQGYGRIQFLCPEQRSSILSSIIADFAAASEQNGIPYRVKTFFSPGGQEFDSMLRQPDSLNTAFICDSWDTIEMVEAARRCSLHIPNDIGIVMIHDELLGGRFHISELLYPKVTVIRVNVMNMAERAVKILFQLIDKKEKQIDAAEENAVLVIQSPRHVED